MRKDFIHAQHTLVVSDIHLADAEPTHPKNPLWKRFKRREHFIDASFKTFLEKMQSEISEDGIELVLNGDIFDFDSVMVLPTNDPEMHLSWLERRRGLAAEEPKSRFKMQVILRDHPVFMDALRSFILKGNRVVFVIGNHDMELQWLTVRQDVINKLDLPEVFLDHVRFCEWFYVSNQDTLIEHGNQYDGYCLSANPINPLIRKGRRIFVRVPFGNLAGKYMVNGMGLFNPHADSSFIKNSVWEYLKFYFRYMMRIQPFLFWTWFWSAMITLVYSLSEGFLPAMTDPMTVSARVEDIALRANATPSMVWSLKELHVHPAIFNPLKIARELWLDRAILLGLVFFVSFSFFSYMHVLFTASAWWILVPLLFLLPAFLFYASGVTSELESTQNFGFENSPLSAQIAQVSRVCQGHVHRARHIFNGGIEYINTGTWSPAYRDVECTQPYGRKCFAWIKPGSEGADQPRVSELYEWKDVSRELIEAEGVPVPKAVSDREMISG
jgi:UDP-2,3-diacylglucosamine pyrophosphatase LpxH